jgi:RimJ/RimL family protein N-acetyltransferase
MDGFQIRTAVPDKDYAQLAALLSQVWSDPVNPDGLREWDTTEDGRIMNRRMVLVDADEKVVGYSSVFREGSAENGRYDIWVCVESRYRCQGLGTKLYDEALQFAKAQGAAILDTDYREGSEDSQRFAAKRGFVVDRYMFESTIDLQTFDIGQFAELANALQGSEVRISTLAAEGDTEANRRKLHAVNKTTALDDPASHGTFPDFAEFNKMWNTASWFVPEGQFVAIAGEEYVGLSAVGYLKESNSMYNLMTGVAQEYRGRQIAQVLKLNAIQFAKEFGAEYIRTHNDSQNTAMLAINRKLGYEPQPGQYRLKLVL